MSPSRKSHYEELGVQPDATPAQIKEAYRRLAKMYHPDTNKGDPRAEEKFKRLNEAYKVLTDPEKRLSYHQSEEIRKKARAAAKDRDTRSFSDVFKDVFRKGFGTWTDRKHEAETRHGGNLQMTLELDSLEMASGVRKTVMVRRDKLCEVCSGNGIQPGHKPVQCPICLGIGEVPVSRSGQTVFETCSNCKGKGTIIRERCMHCGGKGIVRGKVKVSVDVPAGTQDGKTISLQGQGHIGTGGGRNGDLFVQVKEKVNPYFTRKGYEIIYDVPLNLVQVVVGGEIEVPTREGKLKLNIEPGLKPGKVLRIKHRGLRKNDGTRGDMLIRIQYHMPDKISVRARDLLDELVRLPGWSPDTDEEGFFRR